ncbi:MAG: GMC family oxidoreductase N-terminal domain-containing protein [Thermoleophilaceae bacterium]|nr:GMC family oxidoreductase N-terminal domain-containing protein [Thermoleophilaceae bacterium]
MQLSSDARFQVLQGMCVGGTTVVNNAVCFDVPGRVLERWNDEEGLDAGLDEPELRAAFARMRQRLGVRRQEPNVPLNPGAAKFTEGARKLGLDRPPAELHVVEANIDDCLGSGYCNMGCPYGKKLSMLDVTLPNAQAEFGADAVRVFSECEAEKLVRTNGRVTGVACKLSDGRTLEIAANTTVLSGGAMACVGSVVGTRRNAHVKPGKKLWDVKLDYKPDRGDLDRLVHGLELIGRSFLAAGALKVMPTTFKYLPITDEGGLEEIGRTVRDNTDIQLHSSHPQGGNPMSRSAEKGVVDSRFRPHGIDGLHVCDASVFPSSITVNPQLTVMALASYAADRIE